jgi:hypothetical protein
VAYDRLALYNEALRICGERRLATLTEAREPRYLLDQVWNEGGVDDCLEAGQWNFAMRSQQIDYDTTVSPSFGYRYGFSKPTDWIRTAGLCSDEYFRSPLLEYTDEAAYWYADITPIYVRFISNDSGFGGNISNWPGSFSSFAAAFFASKVVYKITSDKERIVLVEKKLKADRLNALNKDAMNDPTTFPARGSWVRSRAGTGTRRDGGNRGSLIG